MRLLPSSRWAVGGVTLAVWALAAGSALFWYLRAGDTGLPVKAPATGAGNGAVQVDTRVVARTLGAPEARVATEPAADVTGRLALRGVVTHQGRGAALISVDGKPPVKPLLVGAVLEGLDGWAIRSVSQRAVVIAAGERQAKLEMPAMELRSSKGDAVAPPRPAQPATTPGLLPAPAPAPAQVPGMPQGVNPGQPVLPGPAVGTGTGSVAGALPQPRAFPVRRPPGM
ncbi:hypothetical protein FVQ98_07845 [Ottowia sp. GY511]|uniref:General secretion pathway protein C n=1 Tax=Ottowia flava TaxID=2675430 RepID=A0ABW4KW48_9BURK|nr:hypothetical protein [Ottowia sp. GY511]TXK29786.1 hypothetical protein FVQ98_07845 [Ottowia sp. GY511]